MTQTSLKALVRAYKKCQPKSEEDRHKIAKALGLRYHPPKLKINCGCSDDHIVGCPYGDQ